MSEVLRIATRQSRLALWQAQWVARLLSEAHQDLVVELVPMKTEGDRRLDDSLAKIGGKGLFIKELEVAMLEDRADLAVHSMKDVPAQMPDGFHIAAVLPREDPRDALITPHEGGLEALAQGAVVGTSSLRR
ncbi:MAG: hydroxymethylbilane synthase, partial [Gammaproteobacteria bacterium]